MKKRFLDERQLILDSFQLGVRVVDSGFRPSFIAGIWRGGSSVGIYVQECLQTLGIETDHIPIRTAYRGATDYASMIADPETRIHVHGSEYLLENLNVEDHLLIVDDVLGTGYNMRAVLKHLQKHLRRNLPHEIRVATLYQRPSSNMTGIRPDYCLYESDEWLVFPYEMNGLTEDEITRHKPWLARIMRENSPNS